MIKREAVDEAMGRLWRVTPIGYGHDLAALINYIEHLETRVNGL